MGTTLEKKKIFTYKEVNYLPDGNYEIIDGEKIDMTPTGFKHGKFEGVFSELLRKRLAKKGYVGVGEVGVVIKKKPFRLRAADVVYISKETSYEEPEGMLEIAPDLIIEILSKDDTVWEMNDKVNDYLTIGVKKVVLVDPFTELITIYQKGRKSSRSYKFDEEFDLIYGIKIKMSELL